MKVKFDNVDFKSRSGPNMFGQKLAIQFQKDESIEIVNENYDIQLSFIQMTNIFNPTILRLDGIYFNTQVDWKKQNLPIQRSYNAAAHIVVQSDFNLSLVKRYFGNRDNVSVIRNGTCLDIIDKVQPASLGDFSEKEIWLCASSWRPHKRLKDNIEYFLQAAPVNAILVVAGEHPDHDASATGRVIYAGNLRWDHLISIMKIASTFIHLAWLDHCPNVVVDARACGCKVICSSTGGTKEVAGKNSIIIEEDEWDFSPTELYNPPSLDFYRSRPATEAVSSIDIKSVCSDYTSIMKRLLGG